VLAAFGTTLADLALNAGGQLAPSQARRLRRMAAINGAVAVALGGGLFALWLAVVDRPVLWWQWLLVVVLELALLGVSAGYLRKLLAAAAGDEVVRHSGPVHAWIGRGKHLTVGGLSYTVPIPLSRLVQDAPYDVYVVERPAVVVAMWPTGPESASGPTPGAPAPPTGG
jgi:hypothetical protein